MKTEKTIGISLIAGALGVLIPYIILTSLFDYPNILREESGVILVKFHEGGQQLIWTWWAFAMLGLPLLKAYILIGQKLESQFTFVRWATTVGIIGLIVQMVGLLRWTFVVPVLANNFIAGSEITKEASKIGFQMIHQFGGVLLGEHIGQLFTIMWTVMITFAFAQLKYFPKWIIVLGYVSTFLYLLAQTELFATVIPTVFVIDWAGLIGSTLWIIWLIAVGVYMLKIKME
ncbi:MAG: DUF4386 domain-containing protein [Cytophagia bacterium]|nr:DUF4386 domain-containing protein [Cytophagia bacterium]NBW38661.1 DUF4386 domain-containing protein [Cytophagia bacterium]